MYPHVLRGLSTATSLAAAISLIGCGGGSSGVTTPVEPPLNIPTGMTASSAAGVKARGQGDTIASLLPETGQQFAPVSARSRIDEFHVTAISSA